MVATKTNERPGTRAVLRHSRMSGYKAREVLDLIRGVEYSRATELLEHTERGAATVIAKLLRSCAANAEHNDGLDPNEMYVATCYADEGTTLKRWRPRARGRATRIRKRTCHITIILARMPDEQIARRRARAAAEAADRRARRVAGTRRRDRAGAAAVPAAAPVSNAPRAVEASGLETSALETSALETSVLEVETPETQPVEDQAVEVANPESDAPEQPSEPVVDEQVPSGPGAEAESASGAEDESEQESE